MCTYQLDEYYDLPTNEKLDEYMEGMEVIIDETVAEPDSMNIPLDTIDIERRPKRKKSDHSFIFGF